MTTIKTIARHFGVSPAAVSKALNGLPGVSGELRKEIQSFAQLHNYIPNIYGKGLKGKAHKVFGVIITDNTNPSYSRIVKGIEGEAEKKGYSIILSNTNDDWRRERDLLEILMQKRVDGAMIVPSQVRDDDPGKRYGILDRFGIPYVLLNRTLESCNCDVVKTDNVLAGEMAVDYLVRKGHRNIIHVSTNKNISTARERIEGFRKSMLRNSCPLTEDSVMRLDDTNFATCQEGVREIFGKRSSFTAIFAFNDNLAYGIMKALIANNIRIPDEVAVIGYDDNYFSDVSLVPLTTVPQESEYLGILATRMIFERIESGRQTPICKVLEPKNVVERSSA